MVFVLTRKNAYPLKFYFKVNAKTGMSYMSITEDFEHVFNTLL